MSSSTGRGGARTIALGILASRLSGLVRTKLVAFYFGVGPHADVFRAALRAPNVLQNLLGEQTLSAAFIPIYSRLLGEGREREAGRFAGAIFGLLTATVSVLVLAGVLLARPLVAVLVPGFLGDAALVAAGETGVDRFELTVAAARIIFPMTGLLVLSAWALGVLNSHRRFFLPYVASVLWNAAMIAALLMAVAASSPSLVAAEPSVADKDRWLIAICLGALAGGLLQFAVQLPLVWRLAKGLRPSLSLEVPGVRRALRAVGPAIAGRGVVQISLYVDQVLASLLAAGAVSAIAWAGMLAALPLSVFGQSVAAAELPELARSSDGEGRSELVRRIRRGLRQSAFVVLPSTVGFLAFGLLIVGLLLEGGELGREGAWLLYAVLCGYSLGLPASTSSRLLQNSFFALGDTRTPAKVATVRVLSSATLGLALMFPLDRLRVAEAFGVDPGERALYLGALGLSLAAGVAGWAELGLLRLALGRKVPELRLPLRRLVALFVLALLAAVPACGLWWLLADRSRLLQAPAVLGLYAAAYLGVAWLWRLEELELWLGSLARRR